MSGIYDDGSSYGYGRDDKLSAREFLFTRLKAACFTAAQADSMIDDLLHEEAEKIRKLTEGRPNSLYVSGMETAAKLIDPYKEG
ncbi:hypothetical protein [Streptomyces mutomycini]|uniref:hypothetical protein n=1 Tax=Streptomyces mutomycini TaxID=284036 RepID=UPI0033FB63FA